MKVFVPFFEDALHEPGALSGADLVPFRHEYPVLRIAAARRDDPLPAVGEAQLIRLEDWNAADRR